MLLFLTKFVCINSFDFSPIIRTNTRRKTICNKTAHNQKYNTTAHAQGRRQTLTCRGRNQMKHNTFLTWNLVVLLQDPNQILLSRWDEILISWVDRSTVSENTHILLLRWMQRVDYSGHFCTGHNSQTAHYYHHKYVVVCPSLTC